MTDVRLTALNPEDSKVYPVACNASGELLTDKSGDINLDLSGNLTVGGSGVFANDVQVGGDVSAQQSGVVIHKEGFIETARITGAVLAGYSTGSATPTSIINADGTATFYGEVEIDTSAGSTFAITATNASAPNLSGTIYARNNGTTGSPCYQAISSSSDVVARINNDGSATFAGEKAGFTAEGYLWCKTRRGDTVILDATSNGLATWADYTPPTRRDVIADKIKDIDAKPGVSQDLPETEADTP